jgi:hypothetical protein
VGLKGSQGIFQGLNPGLKIRFGAGLRSGDHQQPIPHAAALALTRLRQSASTSGASFRLICSSGTGYGAGIETVPTGTGRYHPRQSGQPAKGMRQVLGPGAEHDRALRGVSGQQGSPYRPGQGRDPLGAYGATKAAGEVGVEQLLEARP